ncbi:molecular chaperone DnaJ [Helicobacter sp. 13S00401-1]|uniref:molecular chaperone DnaJ n=1 Tax=Helicobacter sp. 13S00401-1 TaxID=1905758 RepID=UPI000BA7B4C5|nr:molecular chaperone DnaJ [Helicobacter sp. 13S00401-1]PAF49353.1 molecular chaperone DnaJ [Helicobacter sp. 13S00401-1]
MSLEASYYEILEVEQDCDEQALKKSYRKLALQYHPDRNKDEDAEERFKLINEAYAVLSDPEKRTLYDRYGKEGVSQGGGFSSSQGGFGSIFEDIFGDFFGAFGGASSQKKERLLFEPDLLIELDVSFKDAVFGAKKTIKHKYKSYCKACLGTGAKDGKLKTCPTCQGRGVVFARNGFLQFQQTCSTCGGSGQIPSAKCSKCHGEGFEVLEENLEISIKAGVDTGNQLVYRGKGNCIKEGVRGDLYLQVKVADDEHFIRHGSDIYLQVPVFFTTVVLGGSIKIPSLRGELELKVPQGAQNGQQIVFRGEGVPDVHTGAKGRLVAELKVNYPKSLSEEQKELVLKLQSSFNETTSKPYQSSFKKAFKKFSDWVKR